MLVSMLVNPIWRMEPGLHEWTPMLHDSEIQQLVDSLKDLPGLVAIYLHGSMARGCARGKATLTWPFSFATAFPWTGLTCFIDRESWRPGWDDRSTWRFFQ